MNKKGDREFQILCPSGVFAAQINSLIYLPQNPRWDAKAIFSDQFMEQKLNYMHANPITGKRALVTDYTDYEYSSASFYELGIVKHFTPKHFKDL